MPKILLIDDDEKLAGLLGSYFERFDLELVSALRPSAGLELLQSEKPDLVIHGDVAEITGMPKLMGIADLGGQQEVNMPGMS